MDFFNKNIDGVRDVHIEQATAPPWFKNHVKARKMQAEAAMRDKSLRIKIGVALGTLIWWGDLFAPEKGAPMVLTADDCATHILVLGRTGSGKTENVANPFIYQWVKGGAGGIVVLDGKGPLPAQFRGMRNYTLIEPMDYDYENNKVITDGSKVALIKGIPAGFVTETLLAVAGTDQHKGGNSTYFYDTALGLGKTAEHLVYWLAYTERKMNEEGTLKRERRWYWTLSHIVRMVDMLASTAKNEAGQREITQWLELSLKPHCPYYMHDDNLMDAIRYAEVGVLEEMKAEGAFASVVSTLKTSWFNPLLHSKEIGPWCRTEESDIDILAPLHGGGLGIHIGPRYGKAGQFATALIRHRLWIEIQKRGLDWKEKDPTATRVLFVMDEAQDLLNAGDMEILAKGRSLGAHIMALTQMLEGIQERMGEAKCKVMLGNFMTKIVLQSSDESFEIIQKHIGVTLGRQQGYGGVWGGLTQPLRALSRDQKQNPQNPHQYSMPVPNPTLIDRLLKRRVDLRERDTDMLPLGKTEWDYGDGKEKPLVTLHDFQGVVKEKGIALAVLNRGGVPRRDFVKLQWMPRVPIEEL